MKRAGAVPAAGAGALPLKDRLARLEERTRTSGAYAGLTRLALKEKDPLRYERVHARIRGSLVTARETALHIAASPIVRFIGELCFALYTPEGDSAALSTGIIVHVHTMSEAIKWMIRNGYESKVGFRPGDLFCNNDPAIGDVHTADVQTILPLHWKGALIGWAAGVTHQVDIGAPMAGHDPVTSISRFDEGVHISCEKIGENDRLFEWYRTRCRLAVRTPHYWEFDEKARLAGCFMIRRAVERLIEEEGIDDYQAFLREGIEEGRRIFKARVRERLVPGRYRTATFLVDDVQREVKRDGRYGMERVEEVEGGGLHAPMEIHVGAEGAFRLSFEGANKPGPHAFNCTPTSMQGGLWVLLSQTLCYDGKINDGSYLAIDAHFPAKSWCNPQDPLLSYAVAWAFLIPSYTGLFRLLSRGFFARGFREEVAAGYGLTADVVQGGGRDRMGEYFPIANFEISSVGLGASAVKDGLDHGYAMWNPESDMGDTEVWESVERGLPYLSRRIKPDTAGFGRYRGGSGWEALRMVHGVQSIRFGIAREGKTFIGCGIFGGYPQATGYRLYARNTNLGEIFSRQELYPLGDPDPAHGEVEALVRGDVVRSPVGHLNPGEDFREGDLVHVILSGGPGLGDPLDRTPEEALRDLEGNFVTPETALKVYGVAAVREAGTGRWTLDAPATQARREAIRRSRRERSVPFEAFHARERSDLLDRSGDPKVRKVLADSMEISSSFARDFRAFWNLPEDFTP